MNKDSETRLRVVSIKELQFLTCLKHNLWGANNSHLHNWAVGDYIVFVVDKKITALARVNGEQYKSDEKIWTNGKYPYKLPIVFDVVLANDNRIAIVGEVKTYFKNNWDNYGIPIRFKLLIPDDSAREILNIIFEQKNSIEFYQSNVDELIGKFQYDDDKSDDKDSIFWEEKRDGKLDLKFRSLTLSNWRQFEMIDIQFHENLTILTGANGTGKTTLLNLLNYHFGWETEFINSEKSNENLTSFQDVKYIGELTYNNGKNGRINFPSVSSYTYKLEIDNKQNISGLYIPSHRSVFGFNEVESIPTRIKPLEKLYSEYTDLIKSDYNLNGNNIKPNYVLKESLISLAVFGYGNDVIKKNINSLTVFDEFKQVLKEVLPPKLGFNDISIVLPDVIFETNSGSFSIDAVSGGIAAIIDLSWQIFLHYKIKDKLVVTIDEPENHLHPEMQRRIMPSLIKAFPNIQFIVITHNPFIISSVKDSNIYILNHNEKNKVVTDKLDFVNKAGTSNDILREALGLPITMPIWVEDKLNQIIYKYSELDITEENFQELRNEMEEISLEKYIPTTIVDIIKQVKKNDSTN
ncbi:AAA family ATPase [Lysinibacillus sp. NPDC095746]|uniref:AAA family ATPase n=1 Tax=Lysinibacillus sp. NPDC095746 TaxID=3364134 RepID=UPI0038228405